MITPKPMSGALGAEIEGIDLTLPLSIHDYKKIRNLLIEHEVIKTTLVKAKELRRFAEPLIFHHLKHLHLNGIIL